MSRPTLAELRAKVQSGPPYPEELLADLAHDSRAGAQDLHAACLRRVARAKAAVAKTEAMFQLEREVHNAGFTRIAGVDEAGRGPLAGPIVAAAVVLSDPVPGLNDSKQLSRSQRETLFDTLHGGDHAIASCIIEAPRIDAVGIQSANYTAMTQALTGLRPAADFALVDGFRLPGCPLPHDRVIKGDARSQSIAAASIVAKVTRDRIMEELDLTHPGYGFARNKGYGTADHLEALTRIGPCPAHRRSFAPLAHRPVSGELFASTEAP